ncbi:hypothetical protein BDN71DRAFT_1401714 [Pleurotus eryngii]|uniref:Acyl-CoA dehydrogenase NM domain-like protein n=1 Tax=Pleurotus eryngii TaxID=5323 RepID=A0A9P5ZJT9_PLEER|nr:hypothetical protein BDN71DRAFT_1401714 [Pleurotus eryngii]
MRIEEGFQITPYKEENVYTSDPVLRGILKRTLPPSVFEEINQDLVRFGNEVLTSIRDMGTKVTPPNLVQYDQWGRRIDDLQTSEGWRGLKAIAQKEGMPGIFYERTYGEHSRSYGFAKVFLMSGDSHMVFCPLSMSDGAARVIELAGSPAMKEHILPKLISRDPQIAFTAGQWMTERPGGSDVSLTETKAAFGGQSGQFGPVYHLDGFKWFSSATDSDISIALARTGSLQDGSGGLSLFLVPLRLPLLRQPSDAKPLAISNNIFVHRLKNKFGTIPVPTAELSLQNTEAYLIGSQNQGVKQITPVLNITRLYSATVTVGGLRKCLSIATAHARVRAIRQGTQLLQDNPLHVAGLASINLVYRALAHLSFGAVRLLGKSECGVATQDELNRLKILTPTVKSFVAEHAATAMEDAMACLGGAGYMEENGFGRQIRDALVEKIWEGTTNILALDIVRAAKEPSVVLSFVNWGKEVIASCPEALAAGYKEAFGILRPALDELIDAYKQPVPSLMPRAGLFVVGHVASSLYLLEQAVWSNAVNDSQKHVDSEVFNRWVIEWGLTKALTDLTLARNARSDRLVSNYSIVFDEQPLKGKL